jgi:hypothetical protein
MIIPYTGCLVRFKKPYLQSLIRAGLPELERTYIFWSKKGTTATLVEFNPMQYCALLQVITNEYSLEFYAHGLHHSVKPLRVFWCYGDIAF